MEITDENKTQLTVLKILVIGLFIVLMFRHCVDGREHDKHFAVIEKQRDTIENLQRHTDSLNRELGLAIERSGTILEGLDRASELARRSDTILVGLRDAISESGSTVRQLVERQQRINRLVGDLFTEHADFKRRLNQIISEIRYYDETNGHTPCSEPEAGSSGDGSMP